MYSAVATISLCVCAARPLSDEDAAVSRERGGDQGGEIEAAELAPQRRGVERVLERERLTVQRSVEQPHELWRRGLRAHAAAPVVGNERRQTLVGVAEQHAGGV